MFIVQQKERRFAVFDIVLGTDVLHSIRAASDEETSLQLLSADQSQRRAFVKSPFSVKSLNRQSEGKKRKEVFRPKRVESRLPSAWHAGILMYIR